MPARFSLEAFVESLDGDLAWRRLELSALGTALSRASGPAEETAARAAIALSYAHWEGYIVFAAREFLRYVADLRLDYQELADPYVALCLSGKLIDADQSTRRIQRHIDAVAALRVADQTAIFPRVEKAIHGEGNLRSEKFDDIVSRLGLARARFELHYNWLDNELLRRRNQIAHGEFGYSDPTFGVEALRTIRELLDAFRTETQNAAVLEVYRR